MRRDSLNISCFSNPLTDDARYFCGLIVADGSISKDRKRVELTSVDIDILEKFLDFIGLPYSYIKLKKNKGVQHGFVIKFTCKEIVEDLLSLGIIPDKSKTIKVDKSLIDVNFIRGVIDGDGTISVNKNRYPVVKVYTGSGEFARQIENFYLNEGFKCNISIYNNLYSIYIKGGISEIQRFLSFIYDEGISINRKKGYAQEIIGNCF